MAICGEAAGSATCSFCPDGAGPRGSKRDPLVGKIAICARRVANQCAEAGPLFLLAAGQDSAPAMEPANRKVLDGDSTGRKAGTLLRSPECGTPVLADGPDGNSGKAHRRGCTPLNAQGMVLDVDLLDPVAGGPVPATPGGQPTGGNFIPVAHKYVRSVKQMLSVRAAAVLESFRLAPHAAAGRLRLAAVSAGRRSRMGRLAGLEGSAHCRSGFRGPESGAQAVDGQAGLGGSQCGLPHCPRGSFGLLHRCRALAPSGLSSSEGGSAPGAGAGAIRESGRTRTERSGRTRTERHVR